jgi:hypothetical protein
MADPNPYAPRTGSVDPSPQAVAGLGSALANLGLMIAGKLDQAELASQYNNGQEILRRNLNQFELNLQSDPNWREYPSKLAAAESDWWAQIDSVVKHQGAKNALQEWWMTARDSAEHRVGQAQLNAQGNAILGTYQQNVDALAKDPTVAPDGKKARWEELTRPLVQSLLIDPQTAEIRRQAFYHAADLLGAENGVMAIIRQPGPDGLPNFDAARVFVADPSNPLMQNLTEDERQSLDSHITSLEAVQDKQDSRANDKTEVDLAKEYSNIIENDLPPVTFKQLIDAAKDKWRGKEISARMEKWAARYRTIIDIAKAQQAEVRAAAKAEETASHAVQVEERAQASAERAQASAERTAAKAEQAAVTAARGGFDTDVANNLQVTMWNPAQTTEAKLDSITQALAKKQISTKDSQKLASSIKDSSTVVHDSAMRLQALSAKDSFTGEPGPLTAEDVRLGQAMLQETVDKTPNLTPAQISDETDRIITYLQQRVVRQAIATAFAGNMKALVAAEQQVAGFGPIAKTVEGQKVITAIRTEQMEELKKRNIKAMAIGLDQLNRTIFKDDKGNVYYQTVVDGKTVWKAKMVWNPTAWVTLK